MLTMILLGLAGVVVLYDISTIITQILFSGSSFWSIFTFHLRFRPAEIIDYFVGHLNVEQMQFRSSENKKKKELIAFLSFPTFIYHSFLGCL